MRKMEVSYLAMLSLAFALSQKAAYFVAMIINAREKGAQMRSVGILKLCTREDWAKKWAAIMGQIAKHASPMAHRKC